MGVRKLRLRSMVYVEKKDRAAKEAGREAHLLSTQSQGWDEAWSIPLRWGPYYDKGKGDAWLHRGIKGRQVKASWASCNVEQTGKRTLLYEISMASLMLPLMINLRI